MPTCFGPGVECGEDTMLKVLFPVDNILKALFTDGVSDLKEAEWYLWMEPWLDG